MSFVTKQVKKYRNRFIIRDSERFANFGSLQESLFSCFFCGVLGATLPPGKNTGGLGNGALTALHDRSDGFYRRQIVLMTKDKPADRKDNLVNRLCGYCRCYEKIILEKAA